MRGLCSLLFTLAIGSGAALAGEGLDIKTGLWQMTYTTERHGTMPLPKAALEKLSPEQRSKMTAALAKQAARGPTTHTIKSCVTAEDLKQGAFRAGKEDGDASCQFTLISQTKTLQEGTLSCSGESNRRSTVRVTARTRESVDGTMTMLAAGRSVNMHLSGKWLSSSCAGAED